MNKKQQLFESFALGSVLVSEEMQGDDFITLANGVDLQQLTDGDKNPMFVTVEVIHEGVSRNRNYYDRESIKKLYKQILEKKPNAYQGHIDIKEVDSKNPDAKTIWIGAGLKEIEGKLTLFAKGYLLPEHKTFKGYIKRAVAAGKRLPVSIYGPAERVYDAIGKFYRIGDIDLLSIDWAREFMEGVKSLTGTPVVTSEMTDYNNLLTSKSMNYEEITIEELKKHRPDLVAEMSADTKNEGLISEMVGALNVKEPAELVAAAKSQSEELEKAKGKLTEIKASQAALVVESTLQEHITDEHVRTMVGYVMSKKVNPIVSEMVSSEDTLDSSKLKEAVMEQMKSDEVKAILRTKNDTSVPPTANVSTTRAGLTKVVEYKK
jgi:hypothetical protein